jgi:formate C-acetyltransferase
MYKFKPATERIKYMRELIRNRVIRNDAERLAIVTDAYRKYDGVVPIIKRPLALKELCERMTVLVEDFEIIVGNKGPHYFSSPQYPEWGVSEWIVEPISKGEWTIRRTGFITTPTTRTEAHYQPGGL